MIQFRANFFSDVLGMSTSVTMLLPQQTASQIGLEGSVRERTPVLYLLHGYSDDDTIWTRRTSIERYASERGLAVVMPFVDTSFYCDERFGKKYWTYLSEELPALVTATFNVSDAREDTFVAGLSMGGYGAFKLALRQPGRFAAAGSLSGALDMATRHNAEDDLGLNHTTVWGAAEVRGTGDDLVHLVSTADPASLPRLWLTCGTEDILADDNRAFLAAAGRAGVPVETDWRPGGHEWGYWDATIQDFLAFALD